MIILMIGEHLDWTGERIQDNTIIIDFMTAFILIRVEKEPG